ncbi:DUF805 domain-containing protein [Mesorhizobium sp. M9A.F.Ca.ET.002.03.1.2]|uniref:DUF805 domain-containing protein n=1 Tax=Mesorhizobium sp. M9A.F.Ca.ET.002.03.1.2 TaxID=2493668 RepID=UPI000F74D01C|nr:DUF805 domain-containing protein [Mesorhizobium sp. M9A.F.Ca.ET.002.03.1.2]AZO01274.1 DUF805 domain-containing protein [Mesorhizobium sp. M9A.F.Ca.ET.002.03.1.2]
MQGEVLHYDEDQGFGFIAGADGNRYTFARENLRREASMARGTAVEFQPAGGRARDVFPIRAQTASSPAATAAPSHTVNAPGARQQQHFGRSAESSPTAATGLWDYFWRALIENYFNFAGRARRKEYWGYCLFWTVALIAVVGIGLFIDDAMGNFDELPAVTVGLCGTFVLATIPPWIGLNVRRLHDIGLTGWLFLVVFIPTIGWLIILVFALVPTQARENQWGPVPAGVKTA